MADLLERLKTALAGRYAVESEIGRGGMAVVYLAQDLKHRRKVAIKVLHPELTATLGSERFLQEIEIVAGLQHPHILPLYDSGEAEGLLYYVMPYAAGESLRNRLDRERQLAVDESVRITVEVADALDYAHRQGVVHRDIKPANILLSEGHAVIADFGIARAVEVARRERLTSTGLGVGTPLYSSPEQATAQETLDGRTDIYSLACVLYEMLAGEPPLTGSTPEMIRARRLAETPTALQSVRDTVPPALDQVIARALARVPADRWSTAAKFGAALESASHAMATGEPAPGGSGAYAVGSSSIASVGGRRRTARGMLAATLAVAAAIVGYVLLGRPDDPELPSVATAADRMQARQLYLRGDAAWSAAWDNMEQRQQQLLQAAAQFDSATRLDPENADAWAGLAVTYAWMGVVQSLPGDSVFPLVEEPALRAIALDSSSAKAYGALAYKHWVFDWKWQEAYEAFMTAVRLDPQNPDALGRRIDASHLQIDLGRPDSALATIRPVLNDTSNAGPRLLYLLGLQYSRDYEAALAEARRLIEEEAGYLRGARYRFWEVALQALIQLGRMEEAAEVVEILPEEVVRNRPCLRSQYFAAAGDRESALSCFDELRQAGMEPVPRYEAIVLAWLGDLDRAFEILEQEFAAKGFVYYFPSDPAFDPLREDPRFADLLAQMGLECRYYEDGHDCFQR